MQRIVAGLVVALGLLVGLCGAQPGDAKLKPGDTVEIEWVGKRIQAEFVEYSGTGWITVTFFHDGIKMSPTLPPSDIRVLDGGGGAGKGPKRPLRTWTDTTGKFKTKARFIALDGDELTLETEAGKKVTMELSKLSDADQAMARKIAAKAGPKPIADGATDNPFAGTTQPDRRRAGEPGMDKADDEPAAVEVAAGDWSGCKTITEGTSGAWSVPLDGAALPEKLTTTSISLPQSAPGREGFFEKVDSLHLACGAGRGCVVIHDSSPGGPGKATLSFVDLVRGKAGNPVRMPSGLKVLDVEVSGEFVLTVPDGSMRSGQTDRHKSSLGVWKVNGRGAEPVRLWNVQQPDNIHTVAPSYAEFIDAEHVVCVTFPNRLAVWNVSQAKAIYAMEIDYGNEPVVSPGGKYLAAAVGGKVCLFDALTGETAGCLPGGHGTIDRLSFRPDGGQLASLSSMRLVVWDLAKGEVYRDMAFSTGIGSDSVDWLYGGYVLCGGSSLVDLEHRVVIWEYLRDAGRGAPVAWGEYGGQFWYAFEAAGGQGRMLSTAFLPHDDVRRAAASLTSAEQPMIVQPGASFTLDIRVQGDAAEQQQVHKALTDRLEAAGMTVGNGGPLVLQATTSTGESREMSFRAIGPSSRKDETATVTEQISTVAILENGKTIWQTGTGGRLPLFLEVRRGETIQQAIARHQAPDFAYFGQVDLPRFLARPVDVRPFGFSRLTPQGVVNTNPPPRPQGPGN